LQAIFKQFDKQSKGSLDYQTFGELIKVIAPDIRPRDLLALSDKFDDNKDGVIDQKELYDHLKYGVKGVD